ncbi:MAG: phenylalanine--tRNA ligase subunit alpha [Gammaproteobacteria bacterium]|nr:phenylalanine--tRNA ligase subunit alpha [Gammaproteobacteria bacterium]
MSAEDSVQSIENSATEAIEHTNSLAELEAVKVQYLGKNGIVTEQLKRISSLPAGERRGFGQAVNRIKVQIAGRIQARHECLEQVSLDQQFRDQSIDVTLPGRTGTIGSIHPISRTLWRMEQIFDRLGFTVVEGPEIENDYYNFEALNIPANHPARAMHDTFYISDHVLLRTHTSPVQVRFMKEHDPPVRIIAPGKVFRCDSDVTHTPMFHQLEGLSVDLDVTFADLKGVIIHFIHEFFEAEPKVRFRSSYFPFTEPSAEVDMGCVFCGGEGCRICKHTGWVEVLGCGMVHPEVLKHGNIDSDKYTGYAFGLGIERLTMLRYGVSDLRYFFNSELSFLRQF